MILAERDARREAEDRARNAEAMMSGARLEIERLKLLLAKARREQFGTSSERGSRLIEQLELQLAELEETVAEDEAATEAHAAPATLRGRHACAAAPGPAAAAGASAARAGGHAATDRVPLLRRQPARQDRRGRHRDPRRRPAPLVREADRAREVHLPRLREDLRATGTLPRHPARPGRRQPAGDDPVREVRGASAAQPPERALRPGRHRARRLDDGRSRRRGGGSARPAPRADRAACARRRAAARRRHHRAGAGQRQDDHRPALGLCPRRPPIRRRGRAGGAVPLFARPPRRASASPSCRLCRDPAGRRLCRLRRALRCDPRRRCHHRSVVLGAWAQALLRARRPRPAGPDPGSPGLRGGAPDRRHLRPGSARSTASPPSGVSPAAASTSLPLVTAFEDWLQRERPKLSRHAEVAKAMDYMLKRWPAFTRFLDDGQDLSQRTTPPNERCAVSPSAESHGCSAARIAAAGVPRPCTR